MKKKIMRLSLVILMGLLVTFSIAAKSPAEIVREGDWQEALLLYDKYTKDPKGGQMLKRIRKGLKGEGHAKKFNRSLFGQKKTFDPVEVEEHIEELGMSVPDFVKTYGSTGAVRSSIAVATRADTRAKGSGNREKSVENLQGAIDILRFVDSDYSETLEQLGQSLELFKSFPITDEVVQNLTNGSWPVALEAYDNITQDPKNSSVLADILSGLNGQSGRYQRRVNKPREVFPFDMTKVMQEIWQLQPSVTVKEFVDKVGNYGIRLEALARYLNAGNVETMMPLYENLKQVAKIVTLMNPVEGEKFEALRDTVKQKIDKIFGALVAGPWYDALEAYAQVKVEHDDGNISEDFLDTIIAGLNNSSDNLDFNRTENPIDIHKLTDILNHYNINMWVFARDYRSLAEYQNTLKAAIKQARDSDNPKKAFEKILARLNNDKECIEAIKAAGFDFVGLPTAEKIEKAIEQITTTAAKPIVKKTTVGGKPVLSPLEQFKHDVLGDDWKKALVSYYQLSGAPQVQQELLAELKKRNEKFDFAKIKKDDVEAFIKNYGTESDGTKQVELAMKQDFKAGTIDEIRKVAKSLEIVCMFESLYPYGAYALNLKPHAVAVGTAMKKLFAAKKWSEILVEYEVLEKLSKDRQLPTVWKHVLTQELSNIIHPGWQRTGYNFFIYFKFNEVIKSIGLLGLTVETFVNRYGDLEKYNNYVVACITKDLVNENHEAVNKALTEETKAIEIIKMMNSEYTETEAFKDIQAKLLRAALGSVVKK